MRFTSNYSLCIYNSFLDKIRQKELGGVILSKDNINYSKEMCIRDRDKAVEGFYLSYYFMEDDLVLNLEWDEMNDAQTYEVYIKDNKLENSDYELEMCRRDRFHIA